ncbi:MAG: TonB-dependent receptor, partial [Bacteroidia bacterium]|nr:TonB-dependent receptor [Bacteroidia bacterium]
IVITGTLRETYLTESPIPVEVITPTLLKQNPTPNLFEAVAAINGVLPQVNCNVCNTGDIHINGMEGPYTMVTIDGMPIVSGLSTVYGLMGIPNSLVQRLEVVKGPSSTLYGSEAVAGVINVITKDPVLVPKFSVDAMINSQLESMTDLGFRTKRGSWSAIWGIHHYQFNQRIDVNNDLFTDFPLQNRISIFNKHRWNRTENRLAQLAIRAVYEDRWGGQTHWQREFRGGDSIYGESIFTKRIELIGTYQLPLKERLFLQYSGSWHHQNAAYGTTSYIGTQGIGFWQLLWEKNIGIHHQLTAGIPIRMNWYDDNTPATFRLENGQIRNQPEFTTLTGVFLQDEWKFNEQWTWLGALRFDYHPIHSFIYSPRSSVKFAPNRFHTFRFTVGNGFRVVNLFTEDHAALTGAREVIIKEKLQPERSWSMTANWNGQFSVGKSIVNLQVAPFYTWFSNKIIADYLSNDNQIIYDNLQGYAISRGINATINWQTTNNLQFNIGCTWMEVFQMEHAKRQPQLHAPNLTLNYSVNYTFLKRWLLDFNGRTISPMHLPVVNNDFRPPQSPWFSLLNIQITKRFRNAMECYIGIKNLLNFLPRDPILRPFDPFDKQIHINNPNGYTFDPSYTYAPLQGIRINSGIRWNLW